jgi:hypothetical protein
VCVCVYDVCVACVWRACGVRAVGSFVDIRPDVTGSYAPLYRVLKVGEDAGTLARDGTLGKITEGAGGRKLATFLQAALTHVRSSSGQFVSTTSSLDVALWWSLFGTVARGACVGYRG